MPDTAEVLLQRTLINVSKLEEYVAYGRDELLEAGEDVVEHAVSGENGMHKLQEAMKILIKTKEKLHGYQESVERIKTQWKNGELGEDSNLSEILEADIKAKEEELENTDLFQHDYMTSFITQMQSIKQDAPLLTSAEDIECVSEETTAKKCPITQTTMVHPVQNVLCKHRYEQDAILAHIKQCSRRRKAARCPFPGCQSNVEATNLKDVK